MPTAASISGHRISSIMSSVRLLLCIRCLFFILSLALMDPSHSLLACHLSLLFPAILYLDWSLVLSYRLSVSFLRDLWGLVQACIFAFNSVSPCNPVPCLLHSRYVLCVCLGHAVCVPGSQAEITLLNTYNLDSFAALFGVVCMYVCTAVLFRPAPKF